MRLLLTRNCPAFYNMALDEAVFTYKIQNREAPSTLRLYSWQPPAFSLGYFQKVEEVLDIERCRELRIDWVRRPTGGGAILHHLELTYSLIAGAGEGLSNISSSYVRINQAIIAGLRLLGLLPEVACETSKPRHPLCFLAPARTDILINKKKVSGSAQRRKNDVILHHGSIKLGLDPLLLIKTTTSNEAVEQILSSMTSINDALDRKIGFEEASKVVISGFEEEFKEEIKEGPLLENEANLLEELTKKYSSYEWNYRRIYP